MITCSYPEPITNNVKSCDIPFNTVFTGRIGTIAGLFMKVNSHTSFYDDSKNHMIISLHTRLTVEEPTFRIWDLMDTPVDNYQPVDIQIKVVPVILDK